MILLEKEMATHSSVLAWRIPEMAEPGGLPSMGSHRVGHRRVKRLKLLSKGKVELASARHSIHLIKTIGPVDTHETNHWEEDTHTHTC